MSTGFLTGLNNRVKNATSSTLGQFNNSKEFIMPPITVRKKYGYTASVVQGSDKVTACAKADWSNIRDNSFILIDGDKVFYQIINRRKYTYKTSVTVLNGTQLKIHSNVGTTLGVDDDVSFRSAEYNVKSGSVNNGGNGYTEGD